MYNIYLLINTKTAEIKIVNKPRVTNAIKEYEFHENRGNALYKRYTKHWQLEYERCYRKPSKSYKDYIERKWTII